MSLIKTPVKGMPEKLPNDMALREYVIRKIKDTYKKFGFMLIETPIVEHIENLTSKQGGENEKLIFKILKRGEKLENSLNSDDLCDCGLRYDLTLPLSRFYANNKDNLPVPFKSLQIGESFRADRPQKGRFRQFTQCDIDVIGDETNLAEIELISATSNMLEELNIKDLKVRVNDRAILRALAKHCNFAEEQWDTIFIILDKLDKIGIDGVKSQLLDLGLNETAVTNYCKMFENIGEEDCKTYLEKNNVDIDEAVVKNLGDIIASAQKLVGDGCKIVFDPTLVRGMSYYTGTIFEIELKNYNLSVAGGGRYDEMVGKFCGQKVCACGFSIGLERILSVIAENNLISVSTNNATAYLIAKDVNIQKVQQIFAEANKMRRAGQTVLVSPRKNNAKFQKEMLQKLGYTAIIDVYNN